MPKVFFHYDKGTNLKINYIEINFLRSVQFYWITHWIQCLYFLQSNELFVYYDIKWIKYKELRYLDRKKYININLFSIT